MILRNNRWPEYPETVKMTIDSHVPDKWRFVDLETRQIYRWCNGTWVRDCIFTYNEGNLDIRVGQIWRSRDKRDRGREIRVIGIAIKEGGEYAQISGQRSILIVNNTLPRFDFVRQE